MVATRLKSLFLRLSSGGTSESISALLRTVKNLLGNQLQTLGLNIGTINSGDAKDLFPAFVALRKLKLTWCANSTLMEVIADSQLPELTILTCLFPPAAPQAPTAPATLDDFFDDESLRALGRGCSTKLRELTVVGNSRITSAGLIGFVEHCKALTQLRLEHCHGIQPEGLEILIESSPFLAHVHLCCTETNDDVLSKFSIPLERAIHLQTLCVAGSQSVSSVGVDSIVRSCTNLRELDIVGCSRVSMDVFMEPAWECSRLELLLMNGISGNQVCTSQLMDMYRQLGRLSQLRTLDMGGLKFDLRLFELGCTHLERLTKLSLLRISNLHTQICKKEAIWLATMFKSLKILELDKGVLEPQEAMDLMDINRNMKIELFERPRPAATRDQSPGVFVVQDNDDDAWDHNPPLNHIDDSSDEEHMDMEDGNGSVDDNPSVYSDEPHGASYTDDDSNFISEDGYGDQDLHHTSDSDIQGIGTDMNVDSDFPEEYVDSDIPDGYESDVPEEYINSNVPEEYIDNDIPEEYIDMDVPEEYIDSDVLEEYIDSDVPEEYIDSDVPEEYIDSDVPEDYDDSDALKEYSDSVIRELSDEHNFREEYDDGDADVSDSYCWSYRSSWTMYHSSDEEVEPYRDVVEGFETPYNSNGSDDGYGPHESNLWASSESSKERRLAAKGESDDSSLSRNSEPDQHASSDDEILGSSRDLEDRESDVDGGSSEDDDGKQLSGRGRMEEGSSESENEGDEISGTESHDEKHVTLASTDEELSAPDDSSEDPGRDSDASQEGVQEDDSDEGQKGNQENGSDDSDG
ncbi:Dynein regulatory complex subunit 6 [Mortierella sp. GBA30]|nr:Dynein regulatory complex subunit 6 [Mortierella sp. GBA30]